MLNDVQCYSSRDLKIGKEYKLLDIELRDENGFNGAYKRAVGKFEDKKRKPTGMITVNLPKPVTLLGDKIITAMKERIQSGKNPHYVVHKVTTRERADGKGAYDMVDFKWI
ncbi:uncharacterized protein LOC113216388 [Frankliniella occidentalis]|uniref:Uncharacterized protein LOC113216388 n=1 Tax=Frankliniella occidentalis TaxID=133901 RepID=A0A9C6XRK7_FRAOC|nr:uncharacterized protein LOC113216388 [Frankliniella occidentalis]